MVLVLVAVVVVLLLVLKVLRGAIFNRTYGTHKDLHISLFLLTIFGPILLWSPVIVVVLRGGVLVVVW